MGPIGDKNSIQKNCDMCNCRLCSANLETTSGPRADKKTIDNQRGGGGVRALSPLRSFGQALLCSHHRLDS